MTYVLLPYLHRIYEGGDSKISVKVEMDDPTASALFLSSDSSEQNKPHTANLSSVQPAPIDGQPRHGPVAILWDIENCPVPIDVRPEDVAGNIRMTLRVHPVISGAVTMLSAYGDFNAFPRRLREGCQRTGVKLIDVPNGRKDAADKAILVDMFLFALDNPPPSSIMLISGDVDFAPALHILGQRGYNVILVIPSGNAVSSALCNAGRFVWDWSSVVRGEGFVPPAKELAAPRGVQDDGGRYFVAPKVSDSRDGQNEGESVVYRGISQSYCASRDYSVVPQSYSQNNGAPTLRSHSSPCGLNEVLAGPASSGDMDGCTYWVQPVDLNGLKGQLVKLLEMSGGCLNLGRIPAEYQKLFGRPLYVSEYGASKMVNLLKKMADSMVVDGNGAQKFVYLQNWRAGLMASPLVLAKDRRAKGGQEDSVNQGMGGGSSVEPLEDDRVVINISDGRAVAQRLEQFKLELQEVIVSYSCRIFLDCFEVIYQQRYKKPLNCQHFGVGELEELFMKLRDVVVLQVEPASKRKFLVAVGG